MTKEEVDRVNMNLVPLKRLIPEGKFMVVWGYIPITRYYHLLIAPLPIVYLEKKYKYTGRPVIKGKENIVGKTAKELESKLRKYLSRYDEIT